MAGRIGTGEQKKDWNSESWWMRRRWVPGQEQGPGDGGLLKPGDLGKELLSRKRYGARMTWREGGSMGLGVWGERNSSETTVEDLGAWRICLDGQWGE